MASGEGSHAEGDHTTANHFYQHVFGAYNMIDTSTSSDRGKYVEIVGNGEGDAYHTERSNARTLDWDGNEELAGGLTMHGALSSGRKTDSSIGENSFAFGNNTTASGTYSHAEGMETIANHNAQHVFGRYNITDPSTNTADQIGDYIEIVGNGTADDARANARTLDWDGNETLAGSIDIGGSLSSGR